MEFRHLRYFVAVVEEQSFTKAAERLYIAQPPLSRQIQNLEEELGLALLERGSRPVKATEAGLFFYQHAKKVLANVDQMVQMTKRVNRVEQVVKIGFVGSLLFGLLPKIVYQFRQFNPNTQIELIEMGTKMQVEALKQGKIDVGFGRLSISDPAIKRTLLRTEPLVLAVHARHPLAMFRDTGVYLADLVDEKILLYPHTTKPNYSTHVVSIFSDNGLTPNKTVEVREVQLALGLVAAGEGITIVPKSSQSIQISDLAYVPILDVGVVSQIYLIFRHMEHNAYLQSMLDTIGLIYRQFGFSEAQNVPNLPYISQ